MANHEFMIVIIRKVMYIVTSLGAHRGGGAQSGRMCRLDRQPTRALAKSSIGPLPDVRKAYLRSSNKIGLVLIMKVLN